MPRCARADLIVVDQRTAALAEGGDIVQALASGAIAPSGIAADLADLARGAHPGRTRDDEITVFKSVGFALEDLAAAEAVFDADALTACAPAQRGAGSLRATGAASPDGAACTSARTSTTARP